MSQMMADIEPQSGADTFSHLDQFDRFQLRRAVERMREGLYDPLAVQLLTAQHEELDAQLQADLERVEAGQSVHLCVNGAYGQGKSHTLTYLRQRALEHGYVVSAVNLDPRETPLHQVRQVYRALMQALTFPHQPPQTDQPHRADEAEQATLAEVWQAWVARQSSLPTENPLERAEAVASLLPADMPHPFKTVLVALTQKTRVIPPERRSAVKYRDYRPTDFPGILRRALFGDVVPVVELRPALKYRQVNFYLQESLALEDNTPFLRMLAALPELFRKMGYKGWVVLFDEAEAVIQLPVPFRGRNYKILHQLLYPETPIVGLYPVFAFTPDFFLKVEEEDYELQYFEQNYDRAWQALATYPLHGLSRDAWRELCGMLIALHRRAYSWPAERQTLFPLLLKRLETLPLQDTRLTLKGLVDELDQVEQQVFFERWFAGQSSSQKDRS